jgi:hypothetical protein
MLMFELIQLRWPPTVIAQFKTLIQVRRNLRDSWPGKNHENKPRGHCFYIFIYKENTSFFYHNPKLFKFRTVRMLLASF